MKIFIYSRKSKWTGRGESVENQICMCRDYIFHAIPGSEKSEIIEFEDEGYSGKNTLRPQFQKMMNEIKNGNCDYLVCYKLDRLGRNIGDLANLMDMLEKHNVAFISIKERFDTSTPIGKAMLYFAGILAQMEREQIAERVRDNMILLARKGRWLGGNTPLGYEACQEETVTVDGKNKKAFRLVINEEEICTVKFIFRKYLEKLSLSGVAGYFQQHGIKTKRGKEYTVTAIKDILTNPVYCLADREAYIYFRDLGCQVCMDENEADGKYGLISYAKTSSVRYKGKENVPEKWIVAKGKHKGIISGKDFVRVQKELKCHSLGKDSWKIPRNQNALLSGILFCSCGHRMRPKNYSVSQCTEEGNRKFSYLCPYKEMTHKQQCEVRNVQGNTLDKLICEEILKYQEKTLNINFIWEQALHEMTYSKEEEGEMQDLFEIEIRKREQEIRNLMGLLGRSKRSDIFLCQVEKEIVRLNSECEKLEQEQRVFQIQNSGGKRKKEGGEEREISFSVILDRMSIQQKREWLKRTVNKVVWDGEQAHIYLK